MTFESPSNQITSRQHQLLIGSLLAGGGVQAFKNSATKVISARFYEKHNQVQKDICDFLYAELPFTNEITQRPKIVKSGAYTEVYTGKSVCFLPYLYNFYTHENGKFLLQQGKMIKKVPDTIGECLKTGTALALWLAGDGSLLNHGHDRLLYTNNFSKADHVKL